MGRTDSLQIGTAGEHYVAFRLAQLGFVVAIPRGGSPAVDLLVSNVGATRTLAIQVKTTEWAERKRGRGTERRAHHLEFPLGHKATHHASDNLYYVFVDLRGRDPKLSHPVSYIVPSTEIAAYCRGWADTAAMVRWHPVVDVVQRYKENWDVLISQLG